MPFFTSRYPKQFLTFFFLHNILPLKQSNRFTQEWSRTKFKMHNLRPKNKDTNTPEPSQKMFCKHFYFNEHKRFLAPWYPISFLDY